MFLVLFRHNKTPKVFCLTFGGHIICLKRLGVLKKHRDVFSTDRHLFKKDGVLLGELLRCLRIKSWNFTLHYLHRSPFYVKSEGCEG